MSQIISKSHQNEIGLRREKIQSLLKENLYNSLAQAIIKMIQSSQGTLKIFLFIFILVSTCLTSFLVIQSIMAYFTYAITTTSRTIYETPTIFPKVTFCNFNWLSTKFAFNLTERGLDWDEFTSLPIEQKKKLGHDIKDVLIECFFNGYSCNSTDFSWSYDEDYGNCYSFNSGFDLNERRTKVKESNMAGPNFGLQLTLYVNVYEKYLKTRKGMGGVIRLGNSSYLTDNSNNGILYTWVLRYFLR